MEKKITYRLIDFEVWFSVSRNTLISRLKKSNVYKEKIEGKRIYFEDTARAIFGAFGTDFDTFFSRKKIFNET